MDDIIDNIMDDATKKLIDDAIKKFTESAFHELRLELLQYMGENNVARDETTNDILSRLNKLECNP